MGIGVCLLAVVTTTLLPAPTALTPPVAQWQPGPVVTTASAIPECPEPPKGGFYWRSADVPLAVKQRPAVCWAYANLVGPSLTTVHTNVIELRDSAVPAQAPQAPPPTFKKLLEKR